MKLLMAPGLALMNALNTAQRMVLCTAVFSAALLAAVGRFRLLHG